MPPAHLTYRRMEIELECSRRIAEAIAEVEVLEDAHVLATGLLSELNRWLPPRKKIRPRGRPPKAVHTAGPR